MVQDVLGRELHELTDPQKAELAEVNKPRVERVRDALNELRHRFVHGLPPTQELVERIERLITDAAIPG